MLPSSSIDLFFLILAILATRSLTSQPQAYLDFKTHHGQQHSDRARQSASPSKVNGAFFDASIPDTPLTATFSMKQAEGQGPGSRRGSGSGSADGISAYQPGLQVPQITLTPDRDRLTDPTTASSDMGSSAPTSADTSLRRPESFRPSLKSTKYGRRSVSFSLSSMDEIIKSPQYKSITRRLPTPFIRAPVSPVPTTATARATATEGGGVGELVIGMSVGIGLGAGMSEVEVDVEGDEIVASGERSPLPVQLGGYEGAVTGAGADLAVSGVRSSAPRRRVMVIGPAPGGLDHSTELVDPMGVKKEWLMPR